MIKRILKSAYMGYLDSVWQINYAPRLDKFRDIHKGESCFILGNGPSLNKMNLSLLNEYYTFGLNKIFMIFDKNPFKLSYHVAVNPLVIQQSKKEIEALSCPSFLSYLPMKRNNIKSLNCHALGDHFAKKRFYKNITEGICQGYTVTFAAMQIAFFMGFKQVYLIGVDHNFKQKGKPNEKQKMQGNDPNHFDPNYFKGNEWQLADLENSEISYMIAKYMFENDNRKIYDATIEGKLNIFSSIRFEDALSDAKKINKSVNVNL